MIVSRQRLHPLVNTAFPSSHSKCMHLQPTRDEHKLCGHKKKEVVRANGVNTVLTDGPVLKIWKQKSCKAIVCWLWQWVQSVLCMFHSASSRFELPAVIVSFATRLICWIDSTYARKFRWNKGYPTSARFAARARPCDMSCQIIMSKWMTWNSDWIWDLTLFCWMCTLWSRYARVTLNSPSAPLLLWRIFVTNLKQDLVQLCWLMKNRVTANSELLSWQAVLTWRTLTKLSLVYAIHQYKNQSNTVWISSICTWLYRPFDPFCLHSDHALLF